MFKKNETITKRNDKEETQGKDQDEQQEDATGYISFTLKAHPGSYTPQASEVGPVCVTRNLKTGNAEIGLRDFTHPLLHIRYAPHKSLVLQSAGRFRCSRAVMYASI